MVCLLTSAVCHLFGCCAAHVTAVLWRFDYAGIAVLIVASFFPPVYYGALLCRFVVCGCWLLRGCCHRRCVCGCCGAAAAAEAKLPSCDWLHPTRC